jgi:hypothetical protein
MVFGVIVDVDSYIYMYIFFATPLYGGVGGQNLSSAKIEPQSNRDPKKKGDYCLPFLPYSYQAICSVPSSNSCSAVQSRTRLCCSQYLFILSAISLGESQAVKKETKRTCSSS